MPPQVEEFCAKCGYTLRGLPIQSTCPECGGEFDKSVGKGVRVPAPPAMDDAWFRAEAEKNAAWWGVVFLALMAVVLLVMWFVPWQYTMLVLSLAALVGVYTGWTLWELKAPRGKDKK